MKIQLRDGFTIFEVILAMGIMTTSVVLISGMQMRALFRVIDDRDTIEKVFLVKKDLYSSLLYPISKNKIINKIDEPEIVITTEVVTIAKKSALERWHDTLKIIRSEGVWKKDQFTRSVTMGSIIFKPEEKKEKGS